MGRSKRHFKSRTIVSTLTFCFVFAVTTAGCSASFNKNSKEASSDTTIVDDIVGYAQNLFRPTSGGTSVASSASYKLKGVSVGAVVTQESGSASYKNKEPMSEQIKANP